MTTWVIVRSRVCVIAINKMRILEPWICHLPLEIWNLESGIWNQAKRGICHLKIRQKKNLHSPFLDHLIAPCLYCPTTVSKEILRAFYANCLVEVMNKCNSRCLFDNHNALILCIFSYSLEATSSCFHLISKSKRTAENACADLKLHHRRDTILPRKVNHGYKHARSYRSFNFNLAPKTKT